ncbi:GTP-binding protein [Pseudonocardia sp. CA-107938]|uniref:GTP-binding protein n=1 Tax=Pseudonocardia sp. CA-107938 TaxID=3240021 RepID=UPI003D940F60
MRPLSPVLNLGVLAHVDAGKTSLTERLLFRAGVIAELGSVDRGTTATDSLDLERRRGITIRTAVAAFTLTTPTGPRLVELVDTPGHPDFVAEVERALAVLDGVVLVVSAVEGVQARTRVLMRAVRRLRLPCLLFVNKVDRAGADPDRVVAEIAAELTPAIVPVVDVVHAGDRAATVRARCPSAVAETLAEHDDIVLDAWAAGRADARLVAERLAARTADGSVHPVLAGSAITGAGVDELVDAIATLLPAAGGDPDGPVSGTVFAIERGSTGERIAQVRMLTGTLRARDRLPAGRVTAIEPAEPGAPADVLPAGRIGRVRGLATARVGDAVGTSPAGCITQFAPPGLETVVVPDDPRWAGELRVALGRIADEDPLVDLRQDARTGDLAVSLYGEVQQEVIAARLAAEDGIGVTFRPVTPICIERVTGTGAAAEIIDTGDNPFLATVGLRIESAADGAGPQFRREVELGSMPAAFMRAVEETVVETLTEGLAGWAVVDAAVTMTHSGYWARQSHAHGTFDKSMSSTAGDFRLLTPLVLMAALRQAGTQVLEPVDRFLLEAPEAALPALWPELSRLGAVPDAPRIVGGTARLEGVVPAVAVQELRRGLAGRTGGVGVLETEHGGYRPATGAPPRRARTEPDPLDRRAYLLRVQRRV